MKRGRSGLTLAIAGLLVAGIWLGVAVTGQAATTQQVKANLACEPGTAKSTVGCAVTITNVGGNNVTKIELTVTATAGTFLNSSDPRCQPNGSTLTCKIPKMSAGQIIVETHELQLTATATQTMLGRFSPNPNGRGSDDIIVTPIGGVTTTLNSSNDFDGQFADSNMDDVQTATNLSANNFYSTGATLAGAGFTVGLTVNERNVSGVTSNCPTGCFGAQEIDFEITPLPNTSFPNLYTLVIKIADAAIPNSVDEDELDVRHDGDPVPLCDGDTLPANEPCIVDRDIANGSAKNATIIVSGPGDENGSWGVG